MKSRAITAPLAAVLIGLGPIVAAEGAPVSLLCRNTSSGATWTVTVDEQAATVDGIPARITPRLISWKDEEGRFYDLHRDTGLLEMHVASSTGGFYLTDRCTGLGDKPATP